MKISDINKFINDLYKKNKRKTFISFFVKETLLTLIIAIALVCLVIFLAKKFNINSILYGIFIISSIVFIFMIYCLYKYVKANIEEDDYY